MSPEVVARTKAVCLLPLKSKPIETNVMVIVDICMYHALISVLKKTFLDIDKSENAWLIFRITK